MRFLPSLARPNRFQRAWLWQAGIYLSFLAELRLFVDAGLHFGPYLNPVLLYASSVLLCGFAALYWLDRPVAPSDPVRTSRRFPLAGAGLLLGAVLVLYVQGPVITSNPTNERGCRASVA